MLPLKPYGMLSGIRIILSIGDSLTELLGTVLGHDEKNQKYEEYSQLAWKQKIETSDLISQPNILPSNQ